ncbi:hypothetical protein FE697_017620 [Mumia zhuanghuii]|uniref:Ribbon-helix-helix protein, copG family n=2 Tax=Mumia TaxID=1546255 RepID=A0ABW1QLI0_9ACTN|nr:MULTISPECIES: hypothetical protein [Mumia]KAA1419732.1 hypothetical protein FE697_017620 [Mumia zhuanghuii]
MPRRVRLPGADELFRPTTLPEAPASEAAPQESGDAAPEAKPSGRVKHDSKVTVYMTSDELLDLEHARLELRRDLGQSLDRGRLIREAVAMALAEYAENGAGGELARRLGAS